MAEAASTRTLRGHLVSLGAHCQRFEDKMSPGIPDMGVSKHGVYAFLEGKHIKSLPARGNTLVRFGSKDEPRLAHQRNWLTAHSNAGGLALWWVRVRDGGWYLFDDRYDVLRDGITRDDLMQEHNWGSAKDLAIRVLTLTKLHLVKSKQIYV